MGNESVTEFELLVLLAAVRLGPDKAYTVTIADDIRSRTGRPVRRSTVFTTLQRIETRGLIETRRGEPHPDRGGRPPRLISVTAPGLSAAREAARAISKMVGELSLEDSG